MTFLGYAAIFYDLFWLLIGIYHGVTAGFLIHAFVRYLNRLFSPLLVMTELLNLTNFYDFCCGQIKLCMLD